MSVDASRPSRLKMMGRMMRALSVKDAAIGFPATDCGVGYGVSDARPLVL